MGRRGNRESWMPDQPNAAGYWEAKVWMGLKPDGRPDRRHVSRKTKAARNAAVRKLERERDDGIRRPSKAPTVEQVVTRHLEVVLPTLGRAPRTISDYRSKARNDIFPRWGTVRIDRLRPEDIEDGYAAMLRAGHAPAHVVKVHAILSSVLAIEAARGNIPRNPCARGLVHPPEIPLAEKRSLSRAEARAVLTAIGDRRNAARWWLGLALGLRQGEVLGLRWKYADADGGELRVFYQLQRLSWQHGCEPRCKGKRGADCPQRRGGGLVFRPIKERRHKTVPLPGELAALLRAHRSTQASERLAAGPLWQDWDLVFARPDGAKIDPRADWEEWKAILAEAGVGGSGVHLMRHSAATLAIEEGVALPVVKELLGHADQRTTDGYVHVSPELARRGARRAVRALRAPR